MTKLQKLQQRRAAMVAELRAVSDKAFADGERALTDDEKRSADKFDSDIAAIDADIKREERLLELEKSVASQPDANTRAAANDTKPAEKRSIPAIPRVHGKLKAFRGDNAEQRAYEAGKFLVATLSKNEESRTEARRWCQEHGVEVRTMTTTSDAAGGIFVPAPMETAIVDLREEYGVARQFANVMPMSSDTLTMPRRLSGVTAYFVAEGAEITASDAAYNPISLTARKLAALTKITSELSEDALIAVADKITDEMAYAFAVKEDGCLFLGDGTSTYGGINGLQNALAAGSKVTAATGNTAFSTLDLDDFIAMVAKLPRYPGIQPAWYIHQAGWANAMLRLQEAAGGNTVANVAAGGSLQFLGYPVRLVNTMNSVVTAQTSTTGLCYFGDLRLTATMGNRRGVSIAADASRYFEFDLTAIRATERFDIVVHETGTASAAGPMIVLATPGS